MKLRIFSYNAQNSYANTQSFLEKHRNSRNTLIFIQEPFYGHIRKHKNSTNDTGTSIVGPTFHSSFACLFDIVDGAHPKTITYVHRTLTSLSPALYTTTHHSPYYQIISLNKSSRSTVYFYNVYNSARSEALDCIDAIDNPPPAMAVVGDFNTHSPSWDSNSHPSPTHRIHRLHESLSRLHVSLASTPNIPTWFPRETSNASPSVIDLAWTDINSVTPNVEVLTGIENSFNSDHAPIHFTIQLRSLHSPALHIPINSDEDAEFFKTLSHSISQLPDLEGYASRSHLQREVSELFDVLHAAFHRLAKAKKHTPHDVPWWNDECSNALKAMKLDRRAHYRNFKNAVKRAKNSHFRSNFVEKAAHNNRPWDLTVLTKPRSLPTFIMMKKLDGSPMTNKTEFWQELDALFQNADTRPVDPSYKHSLPTHAPREWHRFLPEELTHAIEKLTPHSAPGIDHITWRHIKKLLNDPANTRKLADLFSACVFLGVWPNEFKISQTVTIPKPKKTDYSTIKSYRPITLLSCIGKLGTKTIAKRVQYESYAHNLLHPHQYGGAALRSTIDAGLQVVNRIRHEWAQGNVVSAIAFDLAQFFPSIKHDVLINTLRAQGFSNFFVNFVADYLVNRKTQYRWNNSSSAQIFDSSVGVVQGEVLSPPFANLTIAPILHKLSPVGKNSRPVNSIQEHDHLFFADDGTILVASKSLKDNIALLRPLFIKIAKELLKIGVIIEFDKTDLIHFFRKHKVDLPLPSLDIVDPFSNTLHSLVPKDTIRLLGFFLDRRLSFHNHIRFYTHSSHSFLNCISSTGSSMHGLDNANRRLLYLSCVIPLLTYGFQLWFDPSFKKHKTHLKQLDRVQLHAARWILGAFRTSPSGSLDVLAGLLPMRHRLKKLFVSSAVRSLKLPRNHSIHSLLPFSKQNALESVNICHGRRPRFNNKTQRLVKRTDVESPVSAFSDILRPIAETYHPEHPLCHPAYRITAEFPARVSLFDPRNPLPLKSDTDNFNRFVSRLKAHISHLETLDDTTLVFTDGSYPDDPTTYPTTYAYRIVRSSHDPINKAFSLQNATIAEAETAAIAAGIQAAIQFPSRHTITVFADSRTALTNALLTKPHPAHSASLHAILALRTWLRRDDRNNIRLRWCPSHSGILHNDAVDEYAKPTSVHHRTATYFPFTSVPTHPGPFTTPPKDRLQSMGFAKQQATIEASHAWTSNPNLRRSLLRVKLNNKSVFDSPVWQHGGGPLMRLFRTGSLDDEKKTNRQKAVKGNLSTDTPHKAWPAADASRLVRLLTNHAPHGAYRIRFHPSLPVNCPTCPGYVQSRAHILFHCARYSRPTHSQWFTNLQDFLNHKDSLRLLIEWLISNPLAFTFAHSPSKVKLPSLGYGIRHPIRPPD